MLPSLDPVATLPHLAVDNVWFWLGEEDLLHCRMVSRAWRRSLETSRLWKKFLPDSVTPTWQGYLRHRKVDTCWRRGIFSRHSLSIDPKDKICVGAEYIYVGNNKQVIFYNITLDVVRRLNLEENIVSMQASGKMLAVTVKGCDSKFSIHLYRNMKEVYKAEASSSCVGLNREGRMCWVRESKLCSLEGGEVEELVLPGEVRSIALLDRCVVLTIAHPVSRGGGFSVLATRGRRLQVLYECVNSSPLAIHFGDIIYTGRLLAIVHGTLTDSYSYRIVVLSDVDSAEVLHREILPAASRPYFQAAIGTDSLVYTPDESLLTRLTFQDGSLDSVKLSSKVVGIHLRQRDLLLVYSKSLEYWKDMTIRYRFDLPSDLIGSATQERTVVLWDKDVLTTLNIPNQ